MFNQISGEDTALLIEAYKKAAGENADAFRFVEEVRIRVEDEQTLAKGDVRNPDFWSYINHETHVALERAGCKWYEPDSSCHGKLFFTKDGHFLSSEDYQTARQKTIESFVEKAIPVLATRKECTNSVHAVYSPKGHAHYKGCLRVSLTPTLPVI